MPALSIRRMNDTMIAREATTEQAWAAISPTVPHVDWFDWIVTRPARRGKGRVKVAVLYGYTKRQFSRWWIRNRQPGWSARVIYNPQKEGVPNPRNLWTVTPPTQ